MALYVASPPMANILPPAKLKSEDRIPKNVDKAMDKANPTSELAPVGISIRNGPVEESMDVDEEDGANGSVIGKRKARSSKTNRKSYKDTSDTDDDGPLVRDSPSL